MSLSRIITRTREASRATVDYMGLSHKRLSRIASMHDRGMSYTEIARELRIARDEVVKAHKDLKKAAQAKSRDGSGRRVKRRKTTVSIGKGEPSTRSEVDRTVIRKAGVLSRRSMSRELSVEPSEDRHLNEFSSYPVLPKKEYNICIAKATKVDTDLGEGAAQLWEYRTAKIKLKQTKLELRLEEAKIRRLLLEDKLSRRCAKK